MDTQQRTNMDENERAELNLRINVNAMFRRRIVEEDTLINQRMSWMIWSEALLLTAWSAAFIKHTDPSLGETFRPAIHWILFGLAAFGCGVAVLSWTAILSARKEIDHLVSLYQRRFPEVEGDSRLPKLTGNAANHLLGHLVPYLVPIGFLALQGVLIYIWFYQQ